MLLPEPMLTLIYVDLCCITRPNELTHWVLYKITDILHTTFAKAFYWMKSWYFYSNCTAVCSQVSNNDKMSSLVQVIVWHWTSQLNKAESRMVWYNNGSYVGFGIFSSSLSIWCLLMLLAWPGHDIDKSGALKSQILGAPNSKTQMFLISTCSWIFRNIFKPGVKWRMKM